MYEELTRSIREKVTLTDHEAEVLRQLFIPKKYRKRQYILNAGDVCRHMVFVEKGLLRLFTVDDRAHEHVMQFALEGWWITDMGSFLSGESAIYNIEALEDSEVLLLTGEGMEQLIRRVPVVERYFRLLMQNHIIALQRRIRVVQTFTAEEKYQKLLEIQPGIVNRAPQQYIASYLGITPETLSRIRKQLAERR